MKKLTASVFLSLSLICTGCSAPMQSAGKRPNNLDSQFTSEMSLTIDKLNAEGTLTRLGDGEWETEFSSPNTLSGVSMKFSQGNVTASYKGLSFSVPKSALPAKAMLVNFIEAVDTNARSEELHGTEKDGLLEVEGSLETGDYILTVNENGDLVSFSMPNNLFRLSVRDS